MLSLFVVSLPRSLSTLIYHAARVSLGLEEIPWVSDGEILNGDRHVFTEGPPRDGVVKYLRADAQPSRFSGMLAFLDDVVRVDGRAYKDVVQPFVVASWLRGRAFPVLRVRRSLADIAFAMLGRGWTYPARAAAERETTDGDTSRLSQAKAVIAGLREASLALDLIPSEVIEFDDFIQDENLLGDALARLYPRGNITPVGYIDQEFCDRRDAIFARRSTQAYRDLESLIAG